MFAVSAPGKVILFGEHAVVYGVPAIAASVALHTYLFVDDSENADDVLLDFPDVELRVTWSRKELPWELVTEHGVHRTLNEPVVGALKEKLEVLSNPFARAAALAFLYLYVHLCDPDTAGKRFRTLSTLPVGAGLGSSASFSVCLATALLFVGSHIPAPENKPDEAALDLINSWSFMGESCIHGNPSGIDNVVATRGGAVLFQRQPDGKPPVVTPYDSFPPLGLVLTNTGVPRHTSELVAKVAALKEAWPKVVSSILESIGSLVDNVDTVLRRNSEPEKLRMQIAQLVDINHCLLSALGVSHSSLDKVRQVSEALGLGSTKLTGAGGGGCAITIVADSAASKIPEFRKTLGKPYEVFETVLGGEGVGLAFYDESVQNADELVYENSLAWKHWS